MTNLASTATNAWDAFTGFLTKHATELQSIAGALGTIANFLPIDASDKAKISDTADQLNNAVASINDWLANAPQNPEIVIKESDIETAVRNVEAEDATKAGAS